MAVVAYDGTTFAVDGADSNLLPGDRGLTWLSGALEGQFSLYLHFTLLTAVVAILGMFTIATARSGAAFADPQSYHGTFVNRGFHADYSLDALRTTTLFVTTWDPDHGALHSLREVAGATYFSPVRSEVLGAAMSDAGQLVQPSPYASWTESHPGADTSEPPLSTAAPGPADEDDEELAAVDESRDDEPDSAAVHYDGNLPQAGPPTRRRFAATLPVQTPTAGAAIPTPTAALIERTGATPTTVTLVAVPPMTPPAGPAQQTATTPIPTSTPALVPATPPIATVPPTEQTLQSTPTQAISTATPPSPPTARPTATRSPAAPAPWIPPVPTLALPKATTLPNLASTPTGVPTALTAPTLVPTLPTTAVPTLVPTLPPTALPSLVPTQPATPTAAATGVPTATHTPPTTSTNTAVPTFTQTQTPTATVATATSTMTATPTLATPTATATPAATGTATATPTAVLSPAAQQTQNLANALQALAASYAGTNPPVASKVNDAYLRAMQAFGALTQIPADEPAALGHLENVVNEIRAAVLLSPGLDVAQSIPLKDDAAAISRGLASDAIDAAIARLGNPAAILAAQADLTEGDAQLTIGDYQAAINEYRNALQTAQGA